jgi:glycosyltransferase involved in cell wall biosynthesis
MRDTVFVGVTTWNSELFLDACLQSVKQTLRGVKYRLVTLDNCSTDRSVAIAESHGAEVVQQKCSQATALNKLLSRSRAEYTLLMHSDVILVSNDWFPACRSQFSDSVALVSPEDIGCGPLTRPYGANMPESCFMLFDTAKAKRCRDTVFYLRRGIVPWWRTSFNFDHYYVTHDIPETLAKRGYTWSMMTVHPSPRDAEPIFEPSFTPEYWSSELGTLRYAMGNFYSVGDIITHYHNWFDRVPKGIGADSKETTEGHGRGLPMAFLSIGTENFLRDYREGTLQLPAVSVPRPEPKVTQRNEPNLSIAFNK